MLGPGARRRPAPTSPDRLARDTRFVYLARRIDDDLAARIVELDLAGIHLHEEPARFTPSDNLARSIIGKVADDQTGSTGIELLYDDVLTGTPGELSYERARDGGTIAAAGESRVPAHAGLGRRPHPRPEPAVRDRAGPRRPGRRPRGQGRHGRRQPAGTGEILALANITRNTDDEIITAGANRAVIDVFEPGSVNKVITIAAALEEGLVEPDTEADGAVALPGVGPRVLRRPHAPDRTR